MYAAKITVVIATSSASIVVVVEVRTKSEIPANAIDGQHRANADATGADTRLACARRAPIVPHIVVDIAAATRGACCRVDIADERRASTELDGFRTVVVSRSRQAIRVLCCSCVTTIISEAASAGVVRLHQS
jgi:hypothetical protein